MAKIASAGKTFSQGWDDTAASIDEQSGMRTTFTYDYWIDTTEVTQKDFSEYTGRNPVPDTSAFGKGDAFPVYYVSWYDAVLHCNARSRKEHLDTVYTFSSIQSLPNGSVYSLIGFNCDLTCDGYRLPTEAEWEFTAREGSSQLPYTTPWDTLSASRAGWYAKNSGGTAHPVAEKPANKLGIHDLAGNVFEWTNDWKGLYNGDHIINSIGARQPNRAFEKVIKGGAYNHGLIFMRPSYRSATYATAIATSCEYVGFRCARGAIPNGQYIGAPSSDSTTNPVTIALAGDALRSFVESSSAKLVFVNVTGPKRTLCVVNFGVSLPYVLEFPDDKKVYRPALSPDGRFVAYSSGNVGFGGASTITVRSIDSLASPWVTLDSDSAFLPQWWIDRTTGDTCIVYTNSAVANGNAAWKSTRTYKQKMYDGTPAGSPVLLIADGSFHDGISADGRFALTSFDRLVMRDLVSQEEKQLFTYPYNGKSSDGSVQVCNASIAPDTTGNARCMFLDFGFPVPSAITGSSYGIHEYLFVSSFSDSVSSFVHVPDNEASWDFPRWSNDPRFAVSCARNPADQAHAVYCVNISTRETRLLLTGTELWQPCLWTGTSVNNPDNLNLDSLGNYMEPYLTDAQYFFGKLLHFFWKYHDRYDLLFMGQSYVYCGINSSLFSGYSAMNLSFAGCGLDAVTCLTDNYILPHASRVKLIGINIPFDNFARPQGQSRTYSWNSGFTVIKGFVYDTEHHFWTENAPANFYQTIGSQPYPDAPYIDSLGYVPYEAGGWGGTNPDLSGEIDWTVDNTLYRQNFATLVGIIERCASYDIHVLAINFPESPYYRQTDHFFRYGPSWETGRAVMAQLRALETTHPNFHLYDAYNYGDHDYSDADAVNWNHLSSTGAAKLTHRLDSLIHGILLR
ncbi:MAG: TIGR02171 family protein [Chitinispirillaceae bacterium]|nr:TIGR02171 family protein [Chitinispirillaceae bacterium]